MELVCAVSDKDAADGRLEQILSPQRLKGAGEFIGPFQCAELRKVPEPAMRSTDQKLRRLAALHEINSESA
jgi:hypothetical protein